VGTEEPAGGGALFVVGDVHGHPVELAAALRHAGLVDAAGDWAGDDTRLVFLGDFVDRGPDGIGVINLVMRLAEQAPEAGGAVRALLGNHEILLLGKHFFGDTLVPDGYGPRSFERSWRINGGLPADQERLTDRHVEWLLDRPALACLDDHLLMHSDTTAYLDWGETVADVNAAVRDVLHGEDLVEWWACWRRLTTRYAFRGTQGSATADVLLDAFGGARIVHGHSVFADQVGLRPREITEPHRYAEGKVLAVDAGLFDGGPCLVVRLPWSGPGES
jgi:hypothetical protein